MGERVVVKLYDPVLELLSAPEGYVGAGGGKCRAAVEIVAVAVVVLGIYVGKKEVEKGVGDSIFLFGGNTLDTVDYRG